MEELKGLCTADTTLNPCTCKAEIHPVITEVPASPEELKRAVGNLEKFRCVLDILREEYPTIYEAFSNVELEQFILFAKKHLDYGLSNIAAGTNLENTKEVEFALNGLWYRISDKINRWKNLMLKGEMSDPNNESLLDTFQDIANYAMIAQLVYRGLWRK